MILSEVSNAKTPPVVICVMEDLKVQQLLIITKFSEQLFSGPASWIFHSDLHLLWVWASSRWFVGNNDNIERLAHSKLLRANCFGFFVVVVFSIESLIILTIAAVSSDNKTKNLMNCESDRYGIEPSQPYNCLASVLTFSKNRKHAAAFHCLFFFFCFFPLCMF